MNQQDTTLTWSQVYQDFKGALAGAGEALKVGSEHVYEVLIRQQYVQSVSDLLVIVLLSVASYFAYKFVNRDSIKEGLEDVEPGPVFAVIGVIILIAGTVGFTATHITGIVTGFINPEYGAIKEIMNFIK